MMAIDVKEGHTEVTMTGPVSYEHSQNCRCIELEERCKKSEARNEELELEIEKKNGEIEALKAKVEELETKKNAVEIAGKGCSVKHCGERQAGGVVDLTEEGEDDDRRVQPMIEDKGDVSTALGSEGPHLKHFVRGKKGPNAETSLDDQLQTGEKSGDSEDNCDISGTLYNNTPAKHSDPFVGDKRLQSGISTTDC